jgi:hypothetical protein
MIASHLFVVYGFIIRRFYMRTIFTVCLLCLAISLSAQNRLLALGEPKPAWIDGVAPEHVAWFVGKSDRITEDTSYLEAKSGALADVLSQFMLFKAAKVENVIGDAETKQGDNTTSVLDNATRVVGSEIDSSGLYQQAEWIGPDGTIYVLYIYPLYSEPEFKPDMPSVLRAIPLRNGRIYFVGKAVSLDNNMEVLSREAEQNARMQMLLWLGGSLAGAYIEYGRDIIMDDDDVHEYRSFEAVFQFTSQINQQELSLRQHYSIMQKETDLSYHYYGLYSISTTVVPEFVPEYHLFTYYTKRIDTETENNLGIAAYFNGNSYSREIFPERSPVSSDASPEAPEWLNDMPPDDVLWGIGVAKEKSLVVQNLMAQVHSVESIAAQENMSVQVTKTDYDDGREVELVRTESSMDISNVKRLRDAVTADGITWQLWEWKKPYVDFNAEDALRLLDEQLNN